MISESHYFLESIWEAFQYEIKHPFSGARRASSLGKATNEAQMVAKFGLSRDHAVVGPAHHSHHPDGTRQPV